MFGMKPRALYVPGKLSTIELHTSLSPEVFVIGTLCVTQDDQRSSCLFLPQYWDDRHVLSCVTPYFV